MPTTWFQKSYLRMAAILGALLLILSGCHLHHRGGYGYHGGGHYRGGHDYRGGDHGYRGHRGHRDGHRRDGWRGRD